MTQNTPPKKTRGAQPGNQNALTHGFYSRKFKPAELNDLDTIEDTSGVEDEIKLLRIFMRRVSDQATTFTSLDQGMQFLRAMSIATYTLSRLMKIITPWAVFPSTTSFPIPWTTPSKPSARKGAGRYKQWPDSCSKRVPNHRSYSFPLVSKRIRTTDP
jgi:hypothetical protein